MGIRIKKRLGVEKSWMLKTRWLGEMNHNIQLTREENGSKLTRCIHPPFVECYAVQAFSIVSDFDLKLIPKKNQITMRKVCAVIQSVFSCPNLHSGHG